MTNNRIEKFDEISEDIGKVHGTLAWLKKQDRVSKQAKEEIEKMIKILDTMPRKLAEVF